MKALKYISLTSLLFIAFKFLGAMSAQANGTYSAGHVNSLVGFVLIFIVSSVLWGVCYLFRKK